MATTKSRIELEAALTLSQGDGTCAPASGDGGWNPTLLDIHRTPEYDLSTRRHQISSSGGFEVLPLAANAVINFVYIRGLEDTAFQLRLTHEGLGAVTYPIRGLHMMELPSDEEVTQIELQGSLLVEYLFTGRIVNP